MRLSQRCGGILANLSLQDCWKSATLEGFWAGTATASQQDSGQDFDLVTPKSGVEFQLCVQNRCPATKPEVHFSLRSRSDGPAFSSTWNLAKSLGDHQDAFRRHNPYWSSLLSSDFRLGNLPCRQSPSYGGVRNSDLNWGTCDLQFAGCFCKVFCDLLDESLLCSLGNSHHCQEHSPLFHDFGLCG